MRKEQELHEDFKKDSNFENILSVMNNTLYRAEDELLENSPERFPTVHVIGAPRSGTTLAVQLLAEGLNIGFINNLIAAFWKAPLFGIALSDQLLNNQYQSSFSSKFGRTDRIQEPHEFGYFWNYHLNYNDFQQQDERHEEGIDWDRLSTLLTNMCRSFHKPVIFKSFLLGFHASKMTKELPKSCFIYIRRNVIDNAMSILKMRRSYAGDMDKWVSMKPEQYSYLKDQDRYVQSVGQVLFMEHEYFKQMEEIPEKNKLIIDYTDLCGQPGNALYEVHQLIGNHYKEESDVPFENRKRLEISRYERNSTEAEKLKRAERLLISEITEIGRATGKGKWR